jgi:hypothetical protein
MMNFIAPGKIRQGMKRRESLLLLIFSLGFALPVMEPLRTTNGAMETVPLTETSFDYLTSTHVANQAQALSRYLHTYYPGYGRGNRFDGYGFGEGQFVCTTFAAEVLWRAGWPVSKTTWDQIQINTLRPGADLGQLLAAGDPRMKGIVFALTQSAGGHEVLLKDLQPGDWIQYWYTQSGKVKGHVVMVQQVFSSETGTSLRVLGANESTRGVAELTLDLLDKNGKCRYLAAFAVRPLRVHPKTDPRVRAWQLQDVWNENLWFFAGASYRPQRSATWQGMAPMLPDDR